MTGREACTAAEERLKNAGIEEYAHEARVFLMDLFGVTPAKWLLVRNDELTPENCVRLDDMLRRREMREPLQHILGSWEFCGLSFRVDRRALIPRMETEMLPFEAAKLLPKSGRAADVGCGTGCIGLSLKHGRTDASVTLMDLSEEALSLAKENRDALGYDVNAIRQDMNDPLSGGPYDMILSNPPYIRTEELEGLMPEVHFDPVMALDGGEDGLWAYRALANRMDDSLLPGGWMLLEIGESQAREVCELFAERAESIRVEKDPDGHDRMLVIRKKQREGIHRNAD